MSSPVKKVWRVGDDFIPYGLVGNIYLPNCLVSFKGLSATAKLVWGCLARHSGKFGRCYPKMETVGAEVGITRRQVHNVISELIRQKFLRKHTPNGSGRLYHRNCQYTFIFHEVFAIVPEDLEGPEDPI